MRSDFQDVLQEAMYAAERGNPEIACDPRELRRQLHSATDDSEVCAFLIGGTHDIFLANYETRDCYVLKWKTYNKLQRKGRELDPRYFSDQEREQFRVADAKEWQSFLDTTQVRRLLFLQKKRSIFLRSAFLAEE